MQAGLGDDVDFNCGVTTGVVNHTSVNLADRHDDCRKKLAQLFLNTDASVI